MGTDGQRGRFWALFLKEVEMWAKVTVSNGDKIHAADTIEDLPEC